MGIELWHPEAFALASMGVDVKTNLTARLNGLTSDGRGSLSRATAGARDQVRRGAKMIEAVWRWSRSESSLVVVGSEHPAGIPGDCEACSFSTIVWEPSFYQGLFGPMLRSALRRGIAYPWGLQTKLGPEAQWILSSDSYSSPGTAPLWLHSNAINDSVPEPSYVVFFTFAGQ